MVSKFSTFKALALKARKTKDQGDFKQALSFGIDNRISVKRIREYL